MDAALRKLIDDMFETMYAAPGIGLAATQVNVHKRLLVIDISEKRNERLTLINPEIVSHSGMEETEEGCLSIPGIYEKVKRADQHPRAGAGSRWQAVRDGCRRPARRVHSA